MGRTLKYLMFGLILAVVASPFTLSQTADPFIGTWKLDVANSKFESGRPHKSVTWTFRDGKDGMVLVTFERINARGNRTLSRSSFKRDGKDYPFFLLGAQIAYSASIRSIDAYTAEHIVRADENATGTFTMTVSKDGKTMTYAGKATNARGQQVNDVLVYERQ